MKTSDFFWIKKCQNSNSHVLSMKVIPFYEKYDVMPNIAYILVQIYLRFTEYQF